MPKFLTKHRYAICCILSGLASLLSFVNPLLAGVFVNRAISAISVPSIRPLILGMALVNGTRIGLRSAVSSVLKGRQRAPIIWLQKRISKRLWWLEPVLHGWGLPGILLKKFGRWLNFHRLTSRLLSLGHHKSPIKRPLTLSIASSIVYLAADACVTALSGVLFYFTHSYVFCLLAVLLPAAASIPWFTKKSKRLRRVKHAASAL